jgi:hypothetical protein
MQHGVSMQPKKWIGSIEMIFKQSYGDVTFKLGDVTFTLCHDIL